LTELAKSPLLLTLICLVAQAGGIRELPTRRASLFELIVRLLLLEWDLAKGIQRTRAVDDEALRRVVLQRTAYALYDRGRRFFSKEEFVDVLVSCYPLGDFGLMIFTDLVRDCILVPAGQSQFGFLHYSMQEYLAAMEVCSDSDLKRALKSLEEFDSTGKWEEVLVFYAGIRRDIGAFLLSAHRYLPTRYDQLDHQSPLVRLVDRMLIVADFTQADRLEVGGRIASVFALLKVGGRVESWRERARFISDRDRIGASSNLA
jgi:predicted NACHT family NTPase